MQGLNAESRFGKIKVSARLVRKTRWYGNSGLDKGISAEVIEPANVQRRKKEMLKNTKDRFPSV